jgi:hypothetical protein
VCHMMVIPHMCTNLSEYVCSLHTWGGPISGEKERWSLSLSLCLSPSCATPSLVSLSHLSLFSSLSLSLSLDRGLPGALFLSLAQFLDQSLAKEELTSLFADEV